MLLLRLIFTYSDMENDYFNSFECGFDRFNEIRFPLRMRFFYFTVLFLVFDVEIVLILPFIYSFRFICSFKFYIYVFFFVIFIFILGMFAEFFIGTLNWGL